MKPWIYKHLLLLVLVGLVSSATYADGREEFTKTIKKDFAISKNGELGISNQFGKIEINTWDKNRAKIGVTIVVRADSESRAQDIFDRIDIDFANGTDYVKAVTEIESNKSSWWGGWNNNSADFSINFEVFVPKTVELNLKNRHGNTYISEMMGDAELDIAHGNVTADGFEGNLEIDMAHGNGTITSAKALDGDIQHSNLRFQRIGNIDLETAHCKVDIGDARKIRLDSRHTRFEIGDIDELRLDSRHDHFEIDAANAVYAESQHTTYEISKLARFVDFDLSHGGATIDYLEKGFEEVILSGNHAGFKIRVDQAANYAFDAYSNHGGIRYPDDLDISYEKDKNHSHEIRGKRDGSGNQGTIRARMNHGSLRLR